jgi:ATP-dependent helicase/nuclease subunit A
MGGAKVVSGGDGVDTETALRKGRQVHLLLEHLAKASPVTREGKARQLLIGDCLPADESEFQDVYSEAVAVIDDPELGNLFSDDTLAEVAVSAAIPEMDGQVMDGIIDRLVVTPERVLIVDFKTNFVVPKTPEQTPDGILRQLGAYLSAVKQIYPDHRVEVAVLWTAKRELMTINHDIVMHTLQTPTTS